MLTLSLSGADLRDYDTGTLTESVRSLYELGLEQDAYRLSLDIYLAALPQINIGDVERVSE